MGRCPSPTCPSRTPEHFRIEPYIGHGGPAGVVVRGRVLDNPLEAEAVEGEGVGGPLVAPSGTS